MDPVKILKRAWAILWSYRALWIFGLILAIASAGAGGRGNNTNYQQDRNSPPPTPQNLQDAFRDAGRELQTFLHEGIPSAHISGQALTTFLWVLGGFIVLMLLVGIVVAVARYVSETAVIRMVDEYEGSGNKMTVRQGFRLGWSNTSWRLFLINLIVNLPLIAGLLLVVMVAAAFVFSAANGNMKFTPASVLLAVGFVLLVIFVTVIVTILLHLLRNFFWRICVLENASVGESLRRGFEMVRENWKNVGLMWIVMIGLGIVWGIAMIILVIVTLPVVIVTAIIAALVVALPFLLLVGLFSTFLSSYLPWIAAGFFVAPLFFTLAFSPWLMLGSWQSVYTSTVWTLTYREIKALPALTPPSQVAPTPA
jgi:hypothetical protein